MNTSRTLKGYVLNWIDLKVIYAVTITDKVQRMANEEGMGRIH